MNTLTASSTLTMAVRRRPRCRLLAPCEPSACYCVGRNFAATLEQMEYETPEVPDWFIKPPSALLAHERNIDYPSFTDDLTYSRTRCGHRRTVSRYRPG